MARLTMRQLAPRDLLPLRHVRQHCATVAAPGRDPGRCRTVDRAVAAVVPGGRKRMAMFVALIDDEVCAWVTIRPDAPRFAWDILTLAAGSAHLDAHDADVVELWSGLLEFVIVRAGEAGAKRLFAACAEGTLAHRSLARAGFEAFTRQVTLVGRPELWDGPPQGCIRPQEASDVWSIHHLYHRVTPRAVQFAEARTSASWDLGRGGMRRRLGIGSARSSAFVYETRNGIEGFCRVQKVAGTWWVELLLDPSSDLDIAAFVRAAATHAGVAGAPLHVIVPGYAVEVASCLERAGYMTRDERIAMVRHTTAPAAVHARLSPLPVESSERVVRGVPTYSSAPLVSRGGHRATSPEDVSSGVLGFGT